MAVTLLAGAPLLWSACTDTWDEHYDVAQGVMADQPSLLANIKADPTLANFYRVIEAIGETETLSSPQQFTVWAPKNMTDEQADSVIAIYNKDKAAGLKQKDNRAITQFFQNHIALYARPMYYIDETTKTDTIIKMLNKKYMNFVASGAKSGYLRSKGVEKTNTFNDMQLCNNGILYKTEGIQSFFPNVREYFEQQENMDSIFGYIKTFDEYKLDEESSVAGGVKDGKVIYLDSVTNLSNRLLQAYGYIQREDSNYTVVAPTSTLWKSLYEKYHTYFNYAQNVQNRDSLANISTQNLIYQGRFFNTSGNYAHNLHPSDSIVNTNYYSNQVHNPRRNVWYNPSNTLFQDLPSVECSNGLVYIDNKGVIDPRKTFFSRLDISGNNSFYYDIPTDATDNTPTMTVQTRNYEKYDTIFTGQIDEETGKEKYNLQLAKTYYYAHVTAKQSNKQTKLEYTIPSTMSNVYYNIYLVTCPGSGLDPVENLPSWLQVSYKRQRLVPKNNDYWPSADTIFANPHPVTEGSVENSSTILAQKNNQNCFVTNTERVDTMLVAVAFTNDASGANLDNGTLKLSIGSWDRSPSSSQNKLYSRTLRINEIILVPFETKEEAEKAADDMDAFNDTKLQANKEN